jgi:hypothetical protein
MTATAANTFLQLDAIAPRAYASARFAAAQNAGMRCLPLALGDQR